MQKIVWAQHNILVFSQLQYASSNMPVRAGTHSHTIPLPMPVPLSVPQTLGRVEDRLLWDMSNMVRDCQAPYCPQPAMLILSVSGNLLLLSC